MWPRAGSPKSYRPITAAPRLGAVIPGRVAMRRERIERVERVGSRRSGVDRLAEAFACTPTVFFSAAFLDLPALGWHVCWEGRGDEDPPKRCWMNKGALVKLDEQLRVWALTGNADPGTG